MNGIDKCSRSEADDALSILHTLNRPRTVREIHQRVGTDWNNIVRVLKILQQAGFVHRGIERKCDTHGQVVSAVLFYERAG